MPILKNPKHEAFCQARVLGKTLDESYYTAGYKPNRANAVRLNANENIVARIGELQSKTADRFEVTVEMIAAELDRHAAFAYECKQPSAAVAATLGKAKLFGLMIDRNLVNVTHNYSLMTEEELRFELAALNAEARSLKPGVQH